MKVSIEDISYWKELIAMKKKSPKEYKRFLFDMKGIMVDMAKIGKEVLDEIED